MRALVLPVLLLAASAQAQGPTTRIALGSCVDQDKPQPIWSAVIAAKPDLFVWLGDNVYASDPARLDARAQYAKLAAKPGFQLLRQTTPFLAVWDDHDFGVNDGGVEHAGKQANKEAFLDFFEIRRDSERARREGNYDAVIVGEPGRRVQFILLDTRWFRSPLRAKPADDTRPGRYVPDPDPAKTMLGEAQWAWLADQLRQPAELRVIVSSIQVVAEDHLWEKWANLPLERDRLFSTIEEANAGGVVFVSGDRHLAEISMMDAGVGYPLYDLTASALTNSRDDWRMHEPNRHRVGSMNYTNNFGLIEIDWWREDPEVRLQIRDDLGDVIVQQKLKLSWLRPGRIGGSL